MTSIYEVCPRVQNKAFALRRVSRNDIDDLLDVYSNKESIKLFNLDNCHGNTFYFTTLEEMKKEMQFWSEAYKNKWFTRLSLVDRSKEKVIGTIEVFLRKSFDSFDDCVLMRLDLKSEYESKEYLLDILDLIVPLIYSCFGSKRIIIKIPQLGITRIEAFKEYGFVLSRRKLIGSEDNKEYDSYYVLNKNKANKH